MRPDEENMREETSILLEAWLVGEGAVDLKLLGLLLYDWVKI